MGMGNRGATRRREKGGLLRRRLHPTLLTPAYQMGVGRELDRLDKKGVAAREEHRASCAGTEGGGDRCRIVGSVVTLRAVAEHVANRRRSLLHTNDQRQQ